SHCFDFLFSSLVYNHHLLSLPTRRSSDLVDELNGFVALAHAELDKGLNQDIANDLIKIQHELFDLGGDLASVVEKRPDKMDSEMITYLEEQIDRYTEEAPDLEKFILP